MDVIEMRKKEIEQQIKESLMNRFAHYSSKSDIEEETWGKLRAMGYKFSLYLAKHCPNNEEREIAIRKLEEAVMWANKSMQIRSKSMSNKELKRLHKDYKGE